MPDHQDQIKKDFRMSRLSIGLLTTLTASAIVLSACVNDLRFDKFKVAPYAPEFAIPLISDEVTVEQLVAEKVKPDEFYVNSAGYYEFAYSGVTISKRLDSALVFNAQTLNAVTLPVPPTTPINQTVNVPFSTGGTNAELTYVVTKTSPGTRLSLVINNSYNRQINLALAWVNSRTIGSTTELGANASIGPNSSTTINIPLDNAQLNFIGTNNQPNNIPIGISATFPNGAPTAGSLTVTPTISRVHFKYLEGWLGSFDYLFPVENNIDIKLFNNRFGAQRDAVEFSDPKLRVRLFNSTGYECAVTTDEVYTTSVGSNVRSYLHLPDGVTNFTKVTQLARAQSATRGTAPLPASITPSFTQDSVWRGNSDVNKAFVIFGTLPNKLFYQVRIRSNQQRTSPTQTNFFGFDSSHVRIAYTALLPTDGRVYRYTAIDTFKLDLPSAQSQGLGNLDYADLALKLENGFPASVYGQLYFADENQIIFDSLILAQDYTEPRKLMTAAPVSDAPDYRVTSPVIMPIKHFRIPAARYNELQRQTRYAIYVNRIAGPEGNPDPNPYQQNGFSSPQRRIRLYPDYKIKAQMGVSFSFKSNL